MCFLEICNSYQKWVSNIAPAGGKNVGKSCRLFESMYVHVHYIVFFIILVSVYSTGGSWTHILYELIMNIMTLYMYIFYMLYLEIETHFFHVLKFYFISSDKYRLNVVVVVVVVVVDVSLSLAVLSLP